MEVADTHMMPATIIIETESKVNFNYINFYFRYSISSEDLRSGLYN